MTAAGLECAACGTALPPKAKFCNECGAAVSTTPAPAEYKQVTVLFADVVRSMDIAAAVGAERLREIMADLVECASAVVRRYGGTVDKFTGDGIMAVFGAPRALEDHAFRACLAALDIQQQTQDLAAEVWRSDGVALQLRIGLNSGRVIAGELGSNPFSYTAIGEQVGLAQRMESVAPAGGVMLSGSTTRLVDDRVVLADPELVRIKGADEPVQTRRLLRVDAHREPGARGESSLVGRLWEMTAVDAILARAIDGHGGVVGLVGPPGIGKSRLVREISAMATQRHVPVFTTFCESHTSDIPFHVVAQLLRATTGVAELDGNAARAQARTRVPDADEQDLLLFNDLIGIADPDVELPQIDPDARRRRLTALANTATLARTSPEVYVIEDAHWIDEVSESMLADFMAVISQTPSLVVITYRPEYHGALSRVAGAQTIALAPLSDSESSALVAELLGPDPSVGDLATVIAERASGNPFFVQEIVRDLAERGVLQGKRGEYLLCAGVDDVSVPATLQATIAARIDRLEPAAKQTLSAASVIGSRFSADLLADLNVDPVFDELVAAELIDQVKFTPNAEYTFHHPLIRTVAYESQLKSDRAALHRRLAAVIEAHDPAAADANAALIAEHWEAAGDLRTAYEWHMRAGAWSTNRDITAAWVNWERACQLADSLASDPDVLAIRIAPRTLLCANAYRGGDADVSRRFEELRELCTAAGDKASLAIGMSGLVNEHMMAARVTEASRLVAEQMALLESIADPTLTVGVSLGPIAVKYETGEMADILRWSEAVIGLAEGDFAKGDFIIGSPLATALASRGSARYRLGRSGWREDFDNALVMARASDSMSHAIVVSYKYVPAIPCGVAVADDRAVSEIGDALRVAEGSVNDIALGLVRLTMGIALLHRESADDRRRGLQVLDQVRDMCMQGRFYMVQLAVTDVYVAREMARYANLDQAISRSRSALQDLFSHLQLSWCIPATAILVEMLLARGGDGDLQEARAAIDRLAAAPADDGLVMRDIMLVRLRALLARAHGDEGAYRQFAARYRKMANDVGYERHMALAEAMT
ncbi:MAG TPA: adenylate/guanylate cyclase domain-containing protein [Mycobacterium sp.]|uniref:AAA family ATPase n=1 Tax=Mycobacterium sp. TaxID=1785 RepID=UPI002D60D1C0|nr:adenylate/guanylate cyclase domain-containing protein [Mycobacterium sp.]HZU47398.1 adenylate/guanylate cyclase domain-containing protein [Mycobacterium sp.]